MIDQPAAGLAHEVDGQVPPPGAHGAEGQSATVTGTNPAAFPFTAGRHPLLLSWELVIT